MDDFCLKVVKSCFKASHIRYKRLAGNVGKSNAFDYNKQRDEFFDIQYLGLQRLLQSIVLWEKEDTFSKEISNNKSNENYFERFDRLLSMQFDFTSAFNIALNIYFNNRDEADRLFNALISFGEDTEVKTEYRPVMIDRSTEDFETLKSQIIEETGMQEHLVIERIMEMDSLYFEIEQSKGNSSDVKKNQKLNKSDFIIAVQIYHISVFETFERVYKLEVPNYLPKLNATDYMLNRTDTDGYISLQYGVKNADMILRIFETLYAAKCVDCTFEEFQTVFYPGENKIQWLGSQEQLVLFFKGNGSRLDLNNSDVIKVLEKRFKNKEGFKPFAIKQLRVAHTNVLNGRNVRGADKILAFLEGLKN